MGGGKEGEEESGWGNHKGFSRPVNSKGITMQVISMLQESFMATFINCIQMLVSLISFKKIVLL